MLMREGTELVPVFPGRKVGTAVHMAGSLFLHLLCLQRLLVQMQRGPAAPLALPAQALLLALHRGFFWQAASARGLAQL